MIEQCRSYHIISVLNIVLTQVGQNISTHVFDSIASNTEVLDQCSTQLIFKYMYDLDLKPKWLFHAFWTLSQWTALLSQVSWKCFKEYARYEADMKCKLKDLTFKCDLDQNCWLMPYAHDLSGPNIWAKFHEKPSKNVGDIEWTQNVALALIHYLSFKCDLDL